MIDERVSGTGGKKRMVTEGCDTHANAQDPADRLARAEHLLELNELMVAGLIHDLRTPLMAINLSAEVALARGHDEAVQQAARRIRSSTERMSKIFDHLLNLSRVGAEVAALDPAGGDLQAVGLAALDEIRAADPDACFEVTHEGDLHGVFDAAVLQRVIAHLLGTSRVHAGTSGAVTLHFDGSHRDRLAVRVAFPAVIPAEVQERMFVPGPNAAGLEVPGLGLGLHAIDGQVRAHGGSVLGRSRAPEGTVFELLLPRGAAT